MIVEVKTLTPVWTGGVDGKVDRIHETGILGSLRWWYETIVRGLGGYACDPTTDNKCEYDSKDSRPPEEQLCPVCYVFGATGWRRRFRIRIFEENVSNAQIEPTISLTDCRYTDRQGKNRTPTWYFQDPTSNVVPNTPKEGHFHIIVQSLDPGFKPEIIAGLIQFIADWAALGARAQMGFGIIEPANGRINTRPLCDWLSALGGNEVYTELPSLRNVFFARITPKSDSFSVQDTFKLKYHLRRLFDKDKHLRHFIMGTTQGQRIAAKIKISRPYEDNQDNNMMRVWGWIPEKADVYTTGGWNREDVVQKIFNYLSKNYELRTWREMNSTRDTVTPEHSDTITFLRSLLGGCIQ